MIKVFLGLCTANLLLMTTVFGLGLAVGDLRVVPGVEPSTPYRYHVVLGVASGLTSTLVHVAVYTYFMATSKWLQSATDKAGLDSDIVVVPSARAKRSVLPVVMAAVVFTMIAMFSGAGADPMAGRHWPPQIHLALASLAIVANLVCHMIEFRKIRAQAALVDEALALLGDLPVAAA